MKIVYAREELPKSIFLAGPTPRDANTPSWRPEAIELLKKQKFDGTVLVPEDALWSPKFTYDDQVEWEWEAIATATVVLFWIPREIVHMPAFTTNVEYGYVVKDRNVAIGWPKDAPKNRYLECLAQRHKLTVSHTLEDTVQTAIAMAYSPYAR